MTTPRTPRLWPGGAVLSNGQYWAIWSRQGTGAAFWQRGGEAVQLIGWQPDAVEDQRGWLLYLRDEATNVFWSVTPLPSPRPRARYRFRRGAGAAVIECDAPEVECLVEAWVDPLLPVEFRSLRIRNRSRQARVVEVTSYLEVALFPFAAHAAHPAFSKLFVQTGCFPERGAVWAKRRQRAASERWPILFHAAVGGGELQWETDRAKFLGRGNTTAAPAALARTGPLSGTVGNVLDPVLALRKRLVLTGGASREVTFVLGVAETEGEMHERLAALGTASELDASRSAAARWRRGELRRVGLTSAAAVRAEDLAVALLYRSPQLRRAATAVDQAALPRIRERFGVGRDDLLFAVGEGSQGEHWQRVTRYWRVLGLPIHTVVCAPQATKGLVNPCPGFSVCAGEEFEELRNLLDAVADGFWPVEQRLPRGSAEMPVALGVKDAGGATSEHSGLTLWNGWGGFREGGAEYVIPVSAERLPPMPWSNVVANPGFGCLLTERGGGFTWSQNSREFRLTPWSNDPVADPISECVYLRDESTMEYWSLTPAPCGPSQCEVTHGFGFTRWQSTVHDLEQTVTVFVPPDVGMRVTWIRLANRSGRRRRLGVWAYGRLVLGDQPWSNGRFVETRFDPNAGVLWARNPAIEGFGSRASFLAFGGERLPQRWSASGDRGWFLGAGGRLERPRALQQKGIRGGPLGSGLDPAAILAGEILLEPGGIWDGTVLFGEAASSSEAELWIARYREPGSTEKSFAAMRNFWHERLGRLQVHTPWPELDVLVNGWLLYQATSCRLWGRSALYQSGGAFGFRDQLQDACALLWSRPEDTRAQILLHAAHQFPEGDVLHWWHPPWERGTRTRFSDDLLWLPLVSAWYAEFTGDESVWDEQRPFVRARLLEPGEDEAYLAVERTAEQGSLYAHCCRAIDRSLTRGAHGLPLMGTGDWNDGMNRVGREGKGESVWLGFFLAELLARVLPVCRRRGDEARAEKYRRYRQELVQALEEQGWDGAWYRRAYFDDGTPLGSVQNMECQIDGLVQAWAVISGVANPERSRRALAAVRERLVDREARLIRLLAPPFDRMPHDPGYIKGYVPGIRENGGQYTHAAIWMVQAFLRAGFRDEAAELLGYLLPSNHARDAMGVSRYLVEPYVVAADVYGTDPHRGRGGWTWYTGSAGWLYRLVVEEFLGVKLEQGRTMVVTPAPPRDWSGFRLQWRVPGTDDLYELEVEQSSTSERRTGIAYVDGERVPVNGGTLRLPLYRDGKRHRIQWSLCRDEP